MKPWLDDRYEIRRGGPSGSLAMSMVVHSCLASAELSRLGRRGRAASLSWPAAVSGDLLLGDERGLALGELEYEDEKEELAAALDSLRERRRLDSTTEAGGGGMGIEEDMVVHGLDLGITVAGRPGSGEKQAVEREWAGAGTGKEAGGGRG